MPIPMHDRMKDILDDLDVAGNALGRTLDAMDDCQGKLADAICRLQDLANALDDDRLQGLSGALETCHEDMANHVQALRDLHGDLG